MSVPSVKDILTGNVPTHYTSKMKRTLRKITTLEIIVDEHPWHPDLQRISPNKGLSLNVEYSEVGVRNAIRVAGGIWNKRQKVWKLAYKQVVALGLMDRVVSDRTDEEVG